MKRRSLFVVMIGGLSLPVGADARQPWAASIVEYTPGAGVTPGYTNPAAALGEPTRFTGVGVFPGAVTPFNPPFLGSEVVSIGAGGRIVLAFARPIADDPLNPFGVDLIIFGNTGYIDAAFPAGIVGGTFGAGGGIVEVSADGVHWYTVPGALADSPFPTLGYLDLADPYATEPGRVPSDFTRPVNPALNTEGLSFAELVAAYAGSGGGTNVDLALAGLAEASYLRISAPAGLTGTIEIDAAAIVAPVPAPAVIALPAIGAPLALRRRRLSARAAAGHDSRSGRR